MSVTASERVYQALRNSIVARERRPGDVLSRPQLASELGTSQTPVREALLRLEREGFIRVKAQAATVVAPISVLSVHQSAFLRRSLEQNVVRRLARRHALIDLGHLHQGLSECASTEVLAEADLQFHRGLFAQVGMGELFDATQPLLAALDRCRALRVPTPGHMNQIRAAHRDILVRIEAGDPDGAAAAIAAHLSHEMADLSQWQSDHPTMFEAG